MKILGRALTILVGAAPATYLSLFAVMGFVVGVGAVFDGEIGGLVFVIWGGAGVYGTLSLWVIGAGFVRPWVVVGLVVGTIALTPIAGMGLSLRPFSPQALIQVWTVIGPILVAVSWMGVLIARAFRQPRESSTSAARA